MKKYFFIFCAVALFLFIVFTPGPKVSAADVCCRGRCTPAGTYISWRVTNDCNFELKDWCGGNNYVTQVAPKSPCPPATPF